MSLPDILQTYIRDTWEIGRVEAFEQFVAVAMEAEKPGLIISSSMKFPVTRRTKKQSSEEFQTHGYEVDLVGANSERLVLATVKSFFGSQGVLAKDVFGEGRGAGLYRLLNDPVIRDGVIAVACDRFGYRSEQVFLRFYVGKFSGKSEPAVRSWCATQSLASGPIEVYSVTQVVDAVLPRAAHSGYVDNASIVALKVLEAAGKLTLPKTSK